MRFVNKLGVISGTNFRFKKILRFSVSLSFSLWVIGSLLLIIGAGSETKFVLIFGAYSLLSYYQLQRAQDLLGPAPLIVIISFIGFGVHIPINYLTLNPAYSSNPEVYEIALVVIIAGLLGFISGLRLVGQAVFPLRHVLNSTRAPRKSTLAGFLAILFIIFVAYFIRNNYLLGVAGFQPTIAYAGVFQYVLFNGVVLLATWYLAQALNQQSKYVVLGLILMISIAVSQALLGWRGSIVYLGVIAFSVFWYQGSVNRNKSSKSFGWLLIVVVLASTIMQLGNEKRSENLGGDSVYATSVSDFFETVSYRAQGLSRLAAVVSYFGEVKFTNDFKLLELLEKGESATVYIDRKLYGVVEGQAYSVGTSGPGGPYIGAGLLGTFLAYMFAGMLYQMVYNNLVIVDRGSSSLAALVLYSYLVYILFEILFENYGSNVVKNLIAVLSQIVMLKLLVFHRKN